MPQLPNVSSATGGGSSATGGGSSPLTSRQQVPQAEPLPPAEPPIHGMSTWSEVLQLPASPSQPPGDAVSICSGSTLAGYTQVESQVEAAWQHSEPPVFPCSIPTAASLSEWAVQDGNASYAGTADATIYEWRGHLQRGGYQLSPPAPTSPLPEAVPKLPACWLPEQGSLQPRAMGHGYEVEPPAAVQPAGTRGDDLEPPAVVTITG